MAKMPPSTKPRKPPPAGGAEARAQHDAFVRGEAPRLPGKAVHRPAVSPASADSKDSVRFHQPRKGRDVRRMTVYLPAALANRLAVHCAENDQSLSEVIAASLEKTL